MQAVALEVSLPANISSASRVLAKDLLLPVQPVQLDALCLCRVLALERLRLADLREMQSLQEQLSAQTDVAWRLRERLAEQKLHGAMVEDCREQGAS